MKKRYRTHMQVVWKIGFYPARTFTEMASHQVHVAGKLRDTRNKVRQSRGHLHFSVRIPRKITRRSSSSLLMTKFLPRSGYQEDNLADQEGHYHLLTSPSNPRLLLSCLSLNAIILIEDSPWQRSPLLEWAHLHVQCEKYHPFSLAISRPPMDWVTNIDVDTEPQVYLWCDSFHLKEKCRMSKTLFGYHTRDPSPRWLFKNVTVTIYSVLSCVE